MKQFDPIMEVTSDDLFIPKVREWSLEKYRLHGFYCDIFTSGMRNKWNQLVYIDLFAGAGYAQIAERKRIYKSSSFISLSIPHPFSKYILCEKESKTFEALSKRIKRDYADKDIVLINGDCNNKVDEIIAAIPRFKKGNTLLTFCFVDPYSLNLQFGTIKKIGKNLVDFLILQALHMDGNRNVFKYIRAENRRIGEYLGDPDWRRKFSNQEINNFVKFLADEYQEKMHSTGYTKVKQMHQIRSNLKNLPLYYLAFYSKHPRGNDFFGKVVSRCSSQFRIEY